MIGFAQPRTMDYQGPPGVPAVLTMKLFVWPGMSAATDTEKEIQSF